MPRKRKKTRALRSRDVAEFLANSDLALEHLARTDPRAADFGDVQGMRQVGRLMLGTMKSGALLIIPPLVQPSGAGRKEGG